MAAAIVCRRILADRLKHRLISRTISTSGKNRDTATVDEVKNASKCDTARSAAKAPWVSYGFNSKDEKSDRFTTNATFFVSVTLCLVFGGFYFAYLPDVQLRDWSQREAFLEVRRREQLGLPHVSRDLIEPSKINLPSDEDLGSTEIII